MSKSQFWLKACNRCGGDLREVVGIEGPYVMCVQCGHELGFAEERALRGLAPEPGAVAAGAKRRRVAA